MSERELYNTVFNDVVERFNKNEVIDKHALMALFEAFVDVCEKAGGGCIDDVFIGVGYTPPGDAGALDVETVSFCRNRAFYLEIKESIDETLMRHDTTRADEEQISGWDSGSRPDYGFEDA